MNVQCPCCDGTGTIEAGGGQTQTALLRAELVRVWGVVERLRDFSMAHMGETAVAITGLVGELGGVRSQMHSQNEEISSLQKRLAIYNSWNCRTSDNPEHYEAIKNYREESQQYQAGLGAEPASDQTPRSGIPGEIRPGGAGQGEPDRGSRTGGAGQVRGDRHRRDPRDPAPVPAQTCQARERHRAQKDGRAT